MKITLLIIIGFFIVVNGFGFMHNLHHTRRTHKNLLEGKDGDPYSITTKAYGIYQKRMVESFSKGVCYFFGFALIYMIF